MNSSPDLPKQNAFLAEGAYRMDKFTIYGRYDFTQKSSLELDLNEQFQPDEIFNIHSFTAGGNVDVVAGKDLRIAPGLNITVFTSDEGLSNIYGSTPLGFQAYLRFYPGKAQH